MSVETTKPSIGFKEPKSIEEAESRINNLTAKRRVLHTECKNPALTDATGRKLTASEALSIKYKYSVEISALTEEIEHLKQYVKSRSKQNEQPYPPEKERRKFICKQAARLSECGVSIEESVSLSISLAEELESQDVHYWD